LSQVRVVVVVKRLLAHKRLQQVVAVQEVY
jgi:hypothetical protein